MLIPIQGNLFSGQGSFRLCTLTSVLLYPRLALRIAISEQLCSYKLWPQWNWVKSEITEVSEAVLGLCQGY